MKDRNQQWSAESVDGYGCDCYSSIPGPSAQGANPGAAPRAHRLIQNVRAFLTAAQHYFRSWKFYDRSFRGNRATPARPILPLRTRAALNRSLLRFYPSQQLTLALHAPAKDFIHQRARESWFLGAPVWFQRCNLSLSKAILNSVISPFIARSVEARHPRVQLQEIFVNKRFRP